jgi:rubrerythrin
MSIFGSIFGFGKRRFDALSEAEILAVAISAEEDDGRIYAAYADALRNDYPASASVFDEMSAEESEHRHLLIEMYRQKFGERIPLIRREHLSGFYERRPVWLMQNLSLETIRREAESMEAGAARYYRQAMTRTSDASIRKLLGDLAAAETAHVSLAHRLGSQATETEEGNIEEDTARRKFVLEVVQPGLVGLMDGSVSTLAPLFATAFSTHNTWDTFLVGMAASIGAGISMGLAEGLSDDGQLSGRGSPWIRGLASGLMTAVGGLGHSLPYLIPNFWTATTVSFIIVVLELSAISWIRWRYMDTPVIRAVLQIALGGALVFATGILIGSA